MNDKELKRNIKKALAGKKKAFDYLVDRFGDNVYGYIFSLVKDKCRSDDIFQETWIKIFRNLNQYDQNKPFIAWIITITKHCVYDDLKQKNNVYSLEDYENKLSVSETPAEILIKKEELTLLNNHIEALPEKYKHLILMKYFEGLSYKEIAKLLDTEEKTVKWQLYEARQQLKCSLGEEARLWHVK